MCCFTQVVERVARTRIFARLTADPVERRARQVLVYQLEMSAAEDLAMVLPIPTPPGAPEDAVHFVSLADYPGFFGDLAAGFPRAVTRAPGGAPAPQPAALEVHAVGAFEASFAPKAADFARLDPRFRLAPDAVAALPIPDDYGFAVFKLKAGRDVEVHPMAFTFPTRSAQSLFFPTVHLHGGAYEPRVEFDHELYFQGSPELRLPLSLDGGTARLGRIAGQLMGIGGGTSAPETSRGPAQEFMRGEDPGPLVDAERPAYRFVLRGRFRNRDAVLWPRYHERSGDYA